MHELNFIHCGCRHERQTWHSSTLTHSNLHNHRIRANSENCLRPGSSSRATPTKAHLKNASCDVSPKSPFTGIFSRFAKAMHTSRAPSECDYEPHVLGCFQGNWLSHLDFVIPGAATAAPRRIWTLAECVASPFNHVPEPERLPSDSSFRKDVRELALGHVKEAQAAKDAYEAKQRLDRKLPPKALSFL